MFKTKHLSVPTTLDSCGRKTTTPTTIHLDIGNRPTEGMERRWETAHQRDSASPTYPCLGRGDHVSRQLLINGRDTNLQYNLTKQKEKP